MYIYNTSHTRQAIIVACVRWNIGRVLHNTVTHIIMCVNHKQLSAFVLIWIHLLVERIRIISRIPPKSYNFSKLMLTLLILCRYRIIPHPVIAHLCRTRGSAVPINLSPSEPRLVSWKYGRLKLKSSSSEPTLREVLCTSLLRGFIDAREMWHPSFFSISFLENLLNTSHW